MKTNTPMDDRIPEYISQIRMYINKPRRKYALMQDSKAYNQLCSSLDCIGDTYMALVSYLNSDFPHEVGLRYIYLYGLLQVLFVQQDASKDMSTSLKIQIINNKDLNKIRNIRHDSIGHPTNRGNGKSFHFISRMSITKESFTLLSFPTNSKPKFETIDIVDLIKKQIKCLNLMFRNIIKQLEENEIKHKDKV